MRAYYDFHIHSCLSPCGDNDMTPNNIVNMALLKELDIIAITDHNSILNCKAVMECAEGKNLIVVPGMELETSEEIHVVCLFPSLEAANTVQEEVFKSLPDIKNREDIFGEQLVLNSHDDLVEKIDQMLITATTIDIYSAVELVRSVNGIVIPAHIDRDAYSILSTLGEIPEDLKFKYLEISKNRDRKVFLECNPSLMHYNYLKSSDAHYLWDIMERENYIDIPNISMDYLFNHFLK